MSRTTRDPASPPPHLATEALNRLATQSLMEAAVTPEQRRRRLAAYARRREEVEAEIEDESSRPLPDHLRLRVLKRARMRIKLLRDALQRVPTEAQNDVRSVTP